MRKVEGNIVDVYNREIYPGEILISEEGKIEKIVRNKQTYDCYICPPFIDAHVHIESSMLLPKEFSRLIVTKGTVGIVNDPHEIANVLGEEGVEFMRKNAEEADVKMFFSVPSCVPATPFDAAGGIISAEGVEKLVKTKTFVALSEMMDVPGVLKGDKEVKRKLEIAKENHLKIDGHAPGVRGEDLKNYIAAGITTDHECTTLEEAVEKIERGMKIMIREGSAAKNFEALHPLIRLYPQQIMFCTDDAHPDEIKEKGHIDRIVRMAIEKGYDLFDVLKAASVNTIKHYHLSIGSLKENDTADFVIVKDLKNFQIIATYINGIEKYNFKNSELKGTENRKQDYFVLNRFCHEYLSKKEIQYTLNKGDMPVIQVSDGSLWTEKRVIKNQNDKINFEADTQNDILKIVYINRYRNGKPQIAFIKGVGLKEGAFGSSISHDSHNILAIGCKDEDLMECINEIIRLKGGLVVKNERGLFSLPLPVAGIMSDQTADKVIRNYKELNQELSKSGVTLSSPFMTLAFMSLIVIPELKIGEQGLFDYNQFSFIREKENWNL